MSSLYYPDAFYYKTTFSDKKISTKVDYKEHTDVSTESLKGNILQAFLLYDTVYMHAWDLPTVIHFFDNRANAELLAEAGLLRLLNCNDYFVACHKNGVLSFLADGEYTFRSKANSEDELNNMLQHFTGNYNDYKTISKSLFNNRLDANNDEMVFRIEKEIKKDILNPIFRDKYKLSTKKTTQIYPQDMPVINRFLETYRRIYTAGAAKINDIYSDDVLTDSLKEKAACSTGKTDIFEGFEKLTKVVRVPNVVEAIKSNLITTKDILEFREKRNCIEFRKWLHSNACFELSDKENLSIVAAYIDSLGKKELIERLPMKALRFIATNAIGLIPGLNIAANLGVSFFDTFVIDKFTKWKPQLFIDDYKKLTITQ